MKAGYKGHKKGTLIKPEGYTKKSYINYLSCINLS